MKLIMVTPDNEPVDVDEKDFDAAIKNGLTPAMEYADKEGNISVVKKPDQKAAEATGMVPRVIYEGKKDLARFDEEAPAPGKLESFARGVANAGTFGFSDEIGGASQAIKKALQKGSIGDLKSDYKTARDAYRASDDKAYDENKLLYGVGAAIPTVATLGASLPAQGVKQAAITGAKFGAAGALGGGTDLEGQTDLTEGQYGQLAKDVAIGGTIGGALGGGIQKGIQGLQGAPKALGKFAENRATKAAGGDSAKAARIVDRMPGGTEAFGRDLIDTGIVSAGKSRKDIVAAAGKVQEDSGKKIGDILGQFDTLAKEKEFTPGALTRIIERSKKEVLDPLMESPSTQDLGDRLNSKYLGKLEEFAKAKGPMSFKELAKERTGLDKLAFNETGLDKPLNEKLQALRRIFKEETLKDAAKVADPALLDDYARQNRLFGVSTTAKKLTEEQLLRGQKNRSVSLTDYLTGGAGGLVASQMYGPLGLLAAPIAAGLNKFGRERGNQLLAGGANSLSKALSATPKAIKDIGGKIRTDFADEAGFIGRRPNLSNYKGVDVNSTLNKTDVDGMFLKSQELFKKPFTELSQAEKTQVLNSMTPKGESYQRNLRQVGMDAAPETAARVADAAQRIFKKPFAALTSEQKKTVLEKLNDGSMGQIPNMKRNLQEGFDRTSQSRIADELMSYSRKRKQ